MFTAFTIKILLNNVLMMLFVVDVAAVAELSNFLRCAHAQLCRQECRNIQV